MDKLPAVIEQRGISAEQYNVMREVLFPAAKSDESVALAWDYCKARGLDPMKKPVHIVPVWDSKKNAYVDTIWPSITEVRTTAARTGQYGGKDAAVFGPDVEKTWTTSKGKKTVVFPEWCMVTVYRVIAGEKCSFSETVYWLETFSSTGKDGAPNAMWTKRPRGQIAKCAEAAALRSAFPEECGNDYIVEEAHSRNHNPMDTAKDVTRNDALDTINEQVRAAKGANPAKVPEGEQTAFDAKTGEVLDVPIISVPFDNDGNADWEGFLTDWDAALATATSNAWVDALVTAHKAKLGQMGREQSGILEALKCSTQEARKRVDGGANGVG